MSLEIIPTIENDCDNNIVLLLHFVVLSIFACTVVSLLLLLESTPSAGDGSAGMLGFVYFYFTFYYQIKFYKRTGQVFSNRGKKKCIKLKKKYSI